MTTPSLETTLALLIQEGRANDPQIAATLARHYGPGVRDFLSTILEYWDIQYDVQKATLIRSLTQKTFAAALHAPDSFMGKENIRAWLYAQAVRQIRALPKPAPPSWEAPSKTPPPPVSPPAPELAAIPRQTHLPLILRYGHHLPLDEIAQLLRGPEHKLHQHLVRARETLLTHPLFSEITGFTPTPPHHPREIQRLLDGLLDFSAESTLRDHLETCPVCQARLQQYTRLEAALTARFQINPLSEEEIQALVQAVVEYDTTADKKTWQIPAFFTRLPVREMAWVVLAVSIFLILAWWLNPLFVSPQATEKPPNSLTSPIPGNHVIWSLAGVQTGPNTPTTPMSFSPTGDAAAFGAENNVILWDLNVRSQLIFDGHTDVVTALEFSPTGEFLASGDEDGTVYIWDTFNGQRIFWLEDHPSSIHSLAYSQDGRYLAVGLDGGIWLWNIEEKKAFRVNEIAWDWIRVVALSPDGKWLAAADRNDTVAIWSVPEGRLLLRYQTLSGTNTVDDLQGITRLVFSPEGNKLASGSFAGMAEVISLRATSDENVQGTRLFALQHPAWVSEVQWSADGKLLATISDTGIPYETDTSNRAIYLWEVESGTLAHAPLTAQITRGLSRAVFAPDGDELIVSSFEGSLFRWEREDVSHWVAAVPDPQFFYRAETNVLEDQLVTVNENTISFTNTQTLNGLDIIALFPVPPQYTFINGTISPDEPRIRLSYQTISGNIVTITQRPVNLHAPQPGDYVGASAVIKPIQIHGTLGETVTGSWTMASTDNPGWPEEGTPVYRWHAEGETRISWEQQGYLLEIKTTLNQLDSGNLSVNDLLRLAENLVTQAERPILLAYTVQPGNTCSGIATRYGTTPGQIADANGLGNCDLIRVGQTLLVPLSSDRQLVAQSDLNCDGKIEQIWIIPDPAYPDLSSNFGIVLEAVPPDRTQSWPVWQLTIADVSIDHFGDPEILFSFVGCEKFLVIHMFDETWQAEGLELYRWDGEQLFLVLSARGSIKEIFSSGAGPTAIFTITTDNLARIPDTSRCTHTTTTYEWNGSVFTQKDQTQEETVSCIDR